MYQQTTQLHTLLIYILLRVLLSEVSRCSDKQAIIFFFIKKEYQEYRYFKVLLDI